MRTNRFEGFCAACTLHVLAGAGRLTGTPGAWRTWCVACAPRPPARGGHDGWHRLPLASLDLETTGTDALHDRVVSFALLDEPGFEITGLVRPDVPVPEAAAAVHGITDAMLQDAPTSAEALPVVLDWLATLAERRVGLVVFNACYDLSMLRAEARRHGLAEPDWERLLVERGEDPLDPGGYFIINGTERVLI